MSAQEHLPTTPIPHLPGSQEFKHFLGHLRFPTFEHEKHGPVINVNQVAADQQTVGQKIADSVASGVGSWPFIITQSIILALWIILNTIGWINHWDSYPYILLNLALSFQAAYAAPFVMMSQNRQAAKDRLMAENDFKTNVKGEQEVCYVMEHLDHQDTLILHLMKEIKAQQMQLDIQHRSTLALLKSINPEAARQLEEVMAQQQHVVDQPLQPANEQTEGK